MSEGELAIRDKISFGRNANQSYHTFRRTLAAGLNSESVKWLIRDDLLIREKHVAYGLISGEFQMSGRHFRYNAFKFKDGTINVGRITNR